MQHREAKSSLKLEADCGKDLLGFIRTGHVIRVMCIFFQNYLMEDVYLISEILCKQCLELTLKGRN